MTIQNEKAILKALNILELFLSNNEEMALGAISKSLNLNEGTVSHIVSTLVSHGFLKQRKK